MALTISALPLHSLPFMRARYVAFALSQYLSAV